MFEWFKTLNKGRFVLKFCKLLRSSGLHFNIWYSFALEWIKVSACRQQMLRIFTSWYKSIIAKAVSSSSISLKPILIDIYNLQKIGRVIVINLTGIAGASSSRAERYQVFLLPVGGSLTLSSGTCHFHHMIILLMIILGIIIIFIIIFIIIIIIWHASLLPHENPGHDHLGYHQQLIII